MQILLVTGKDTLDGPAGKAGGSQGLDGVDGNDKAGIHVPPAGAVGPALLIDAEDDKLSRENLFSDKRSFYLYEDNCFG